MNIDEMLWKLQLFPYSLSVYFSQIYVNSFQPDFINYSFLKKNNIKHIFILETLETVIQVRKEMNHHLGDIAEALFNLLLCIWHS